MPERGPSTRAVQAGLPEPAQGEPFLPGPVFAAPFHLQGPADATRFSYQRYTNPTWENLEAAVGELEGGEVLFFASGMAAVTAAIPEAKNSTSPPSSSPTAASRFSHVGFV